MAVVGEANIIIRAITTGVARDIERGVRAASGDVGPASRRAGESLGAAFSRGFNAQGGKNIFDNVANGLQAMVPDAEAAAKSFRSLVRTGYIVGPLVGALVGGISSLVGAFGALIGAAGGAAGALVAVAGAAITFRVAIAGAGFAMNGIGAAVQQATQAQNGLGKSIAQVREEMQQLTFDSEDAALAEQRAALNLEKARESLMKMQDMPVDSRARRDAELSYKEAELAYRRAKDRASDLKKELKDGKTSAAGAVDPFANLTPAQKEFAKFLVGLQKTVNSLRDAVARGFLPRLQDGITKTVAAVDGKLEPAAERFGTALGDAADKFFGAFLGGDGANKLIQLLDASGPNIGKFGEILGRGFETFLDILIAAQPLTDRFITWIDDISKNFSDFIDKTSSDGSLESFFTTAGDIAADFGAIAGNIFNFLGDIIAANFGEGSGGRELLDYFKEATAGLAGLGDTAEGKANLSQFFKDVVENAKPLLSFLGGLGKVFLNIGDNPALGETFKTMSEGLPALESILDQLIDAAPSLAELGNVLLDIGAALTDSESNKLFIETLTIGFGAIRDLLKNEVIGGFVDFASRIFAVISAITLFFGGIYTAFKIVVGVFKMGFGFVGKFIGAIGSMQTFFLRLIIGGGKFLALVGRIGMFLTGPLGIAIGIITTALTLFFTQTELGKEIWANFMSFLSDGLKNVGDFFNTMFTNIGKGWEDMIKFFQNIDLGAIFRGMLNGVIGFFEGLINNVIIGFNNGILKGLNSIKVEIPQWARDAAAAIGLTLPQNIGFNLAPISTLRIPRLAEGGVVSPSMGGSIVNVAEAGKPERIEPLDEDGMSKRDRALINRLGPGKIEINVYGSEGQNVTELANEVSRVLGFQLRRGR